MADNPFITLDHGQMQVAADFLPLLRAYGFDTFEKIMAYPSQTVVRSVPGRSTMRIHLPLLTGDLLIGYLKRYDGLPFSVETAPARSSLAGHR